MKLCKSHKCFDGMTQFWEHKSRETKTSMAFSTFIPAGNVRGCLIWLSGLTCNEENFMAKAGAQRYLADRELMVVCPDTSPRGLNLPGEHESWDFGAAASFYVDAITPGYRDHYRMYSYVSEELYQLVRGEFGMTNHISIMGHSMGGHGALVIGLRNPSKFRSISAFAPIAHPTKCPWGHKALPGYLDSDRSAWHQYDATELIKSGHKHPHAILVDQGTQDQFYVEKQLLPEDFVEACDHYGQAVEARFQNGYDHSYYFVSTFIGDHIGFHAEALIAAEPFNNTTLLPG